MTVVIKFRFQLSVPSMVASLGALLFNAALSLLLEVARAEHTSERIVMTLSIAFDAFSEPERSYGDLVSFCFLEVANVDDT